MQSGNNDMQIDVLRELSNIGSGNAATSLSQMLGHNVDIAIPDIGIAECNEAVKKLGGAETVMVGLLLTLSGDINGMMIFLLSQEFSCKLVNLLMYLNVQSFEEIDEMGFSAIGEMANIMSASFTKAISDMTGLFIDISPPLQTIDMLGAIMSVPVIHFAHISDTVIYIKNEITLSGEMAPANIIMMPDTESLDKLMSSLGIEL